MKTCLEVRLEVRDLLLFRVEDPTHIPQIGDIVILATEPEKYMVTAREFYYAAMGCIVVVNVKKDYGRT